MPASTSFPPPADAGAEWPGRRLGLPATGPRSVARAGRRIAAIAIDWALATLVSIFFFDNDGLATLLIFAGVQIVFLITVAGGIGHLILGMRVVPMAGGWIGVWRPILRTALICVVIPAVIFDRDSRGLHDRIAGTVLVRI